MCPKRLFIYDKVNFRCRLLGTLQFVFLVVQGHQRLVNILFTLSPATIAHIKALANHPRWMSQLLCIVHCLKGLFEKATAPPQTENNIQIQKSTLHNCFGPMFSLKILGIFVLTAHIAGFPHIFKNHFPCFFNTFSILN